MGKPFSQDCTKRIAVVTGANKGIGLEICRQLASSHGVFVILTARDEGRGTEAVEKLKSSGLSDIMFHQLDVADPSSVDSLANFIKTHFGKLDILVNNAAVGGMELIDQSLVDQNLPSADKKNDVARFMKLVELSQETHETAAEGLNINYYGMKRVIEALIPFLQLSDLPRIVNVSSLFGLPSYIPSESIRKAMSEVDEQTEARLDKVLQSYLNDLKEGKHEASSWPASPTVYILSKVAMNTYTKFLAMKYPEICINAVSPGFVKTEMTRGMGILTVEEGAEGPVMLAMLPDGSPSGLFYDRTKVFSLQ